MANELWRQFENRILAETRLHQGETCFRLHDQLRRNARGETFQLKSEFDFIGSVDGRMVCLDAKTTQNEGWNLATYVTAPKKIHQWNELRDAAKKNVRAGYLVWFVPQRTIVWASVNCVENLIRSGLKDLKPDSPYAWAKADHVPISLRAFCFPLAQRPEAEA